MIPLSRTDEQSHRIGETCPKANSCSFSHIHGLKKSISQWIQEESAQALTVCFSRLLPDPRKESLSIIACANLDALCWPPSLTPVCARPDRIWGPKWASSVFHAIR